MNQSMRTTLLGKAVPVRTPLTALLQTLDVDFAIPGLVWRATMKRAGKGDKLVALKVSHTCNKVANPPLRHEACALLALQGESLEPFYP